MKTVFYFFRKWADIPRWGLKIEESSLFGKFIFKHYSNKLETGVDEALAGEHCVIIKPIGDQDTVFKIGYCRLGWGYTMPPISNAPTPGILKVAPVRRKVSDGPFAIKVREKKSSFFAIGSKKISLEKIGLIRLDSFEAKKKKYKKLKLY